MEAIHKELVQEVEKYRAFQKDFQKTYNLRQKLDSQLNENNVVKEELDLLEADAGVYKLIGPVLVKQGLEEAKQNVNKRIEYIANELKRHDTLMQDLEKKQEAQREAIHKLEQQIQSQARPGMK
ncbi:prefoldin subunit 6 [Ixodes scapularis]|uniref:prefoldin subunit 6 n=1 Tax=Ixodes scapularis TaxID=6945 RepID=UPI001A9F78D5|nr:prefoldin subunit 6 [Ixodes scapularis]